MKGHLIMKPLLNISFFAIELAGMICLIVEGRYKIIGAIIGNIVFWLIYLFLEGKMGWYLPLYIRIMVILSILSNGVLGVVFDLYHNPRTPLFDQIQHAFASYSTAIWIYYIVQQTAGVTFTKKIIHFVMIICLALAIGAVYEIMEFAIDQIIKLKPPNQASLHDTDLDLIANLIGGVIASFHFALSGKLNSFLLNEGE